MVGWGRRTIVPLLVLLAALWKRTLASLGLWFGLDKFGDSQLVALEAHNQRVTMPPKRDFPLTEYLVKTVGTNCVAHWPSIRPIGQ